jgi:hypothetical protein
VTDEITNNTTGTSSQTTVDSVTGVKSILNSIGIDTTQTKAQKLASKASSSKRTSETLKFPSDIDSEESGASILFNINVPSGSKYLGKKYKVVDGQATIETSSSNSLSRKFTDRTKRISTAIQLWIPGQVQSNYSVDWNKSDLGAVGAMIDAGTSIGELSLDRASEIWNIGKTIAPDVAVNTGAGIIQALTPFNVLDAKNWYTNQINNPYMEMVFNGVNARTFSFTFKMLPRNAKEAETIRKICKEFRFHAAPELKENGTNLYWMAPSEFDVTFLFRNEAYGTKLFKISTCALTDVQVKYGADGGFNYHDDGTPIFTELTLNLTEMELLTKSRIESGF